MSGEALMASVEDIKGLLEKIPPVQYVAAGSCGVKYVSKGLEIICCRPGKAEFTTLASDPLDDKVYQSSKCRFHKNCSDEQYAVQGPAFVECGHLGDAGGAAFVRYALSPTMDMIAQLPEEMHAKVCNQTGWAAGSSHYAAEDFCFATLRHEADALAADSSVEVMTATPAADAEGAAVRGGLGTNLIATLNAVASPVIVGDARTPEQIEEGAMKVFEEVSARAKSGGAPRLASALQGIASIRQSPEARARQMANAVDSATRQATETRMEIEEGGSGAQGWARGTSPSVS